MRDLLRLWPHIRQRRRHFLIGLAGSFLGNWLAVRAWAWIRDGVDALAVAGAEPGRAFRIAANVFIMLSAAAFLRFLMRYASGVASRLIDCRLRNDILSHLQRLPPSFYDRHRTGDLMARIGNDVDAVRMAVGPGVMFPVNAAFIVPL